MAQVNHLTNYKTDTFTDDAGMTNVVCHNTVIVKFDGESVTLNSGGWQTKKTKDDMNRAANQFRLMYRVFQKDFDWFVQTGGNADDVVPFTDNMTLAR